MGIPQFDLGLRVLGLPQSARFKKDSRQWFTVALHFFSRPNVRTPPPKKKKKKCSDTDSVQIIGNCAEV